MSKRYYQILEVSENATSEDIKKSYRKLATQWHPDKFATKSVEERLKATEKMQELNEAYEVLSDNEKKRRYDGVVSEREFSAESNYNNYFEAEMDRANEKIKKACYNETILLIMGEIMNNRSGVLGSFSKYLDNSIWFPYKEWGEKVLSIEIKDEDINNNGHLREGSELFKFREKMIAHVRKVADEFRQGVRVEPVAVNTRNQAIKKIDNLLQKNGLISADLGEYSNYREQINNLFKVYEIDYLELEITRKIKSLTKSKGRNFQEAEINYEKSFSNSSNYSGYDYKNLNDEEKGREFKQPPKGNNNSSMFKNDYKEKENWEWGGWWNKNKNSVSERKRILQEKIKKLEAELAILKSEYQSLGGQSDENKYQAVINSKESELQNYQRSLVEINNIENSLSNNEFSISSLIWVVIPVFLLAGLLIIVKKRKAKGKSI